jgi:hypothetical protein
MSDRDIHQLSGLIRIGFSMSDRDEFLEPTKRKLAMRAAYICSRSECRALTLSPSPNRSDDYVYIGVAAHITAAATGGPRYNASLSSAERASIDNAIFLCETCATLVDRNQGLDYPIPVLREWKINHEVWVGEHLNRAPQHIAAEVQAKALENSRAAALRAVAHEVYVDLSVLQDAKFQQSATIGVYLVYPRVQFSVLQTVIASGVFSHRHDNDLLRLMYRCLQISMEFDNRLGLTEQSCLRASVDDITIWQSTLTSGIVLETVRSAFRELGELVFTKYSAESGIDKDTVLFPQ